MRSCRRRALVAVVAGTAALGAALGSPLASSAGAAHRPLETAIFDTAPYTGDDADVGFRRTVAAGARSVRLRVDWSAIAPKGSTKPAGFDARNQADPRYHWTIPDFLLKHAVAAGLKPILVLNAAPSWAEQGHISGRAGTSRPIPKEYGDFAFAAAQRYSGGLPGLPRVRRWQAWNEPNLSSYINPQYDAPITQPITPANRPLSPDVYRPLVNAFADAVHSVSSKNLVIAGGLAPFAKFEPFAQAVAPLRFMRQLLCMTRKNRPQPGCTARTKFDVWAVHPYTQGGPTHHALLPDNVSIGDMPQMRRLLLAASRAHHVVSSHRPKFWVTEFSWDTNPPDAGGVPLKLHARWVAEALYRMWRSGATLVTWFQLRDGFNPTVPKAREFTSGLYFRCGLLLACDRPKPALRAFRFPFVAFKHGARIRVWGRTPRGKRAKVTIQQRRGGRFRRLARLRTDRFGIFTASLRSRSRKPLRAVGAGSRSLPFTPKKTKDLPVSPFGGNPCDRSESEPRLCPR
jgi:hypothetical protein